MTELTARQQELLDELLKDFKGDARDLFGEGGLLGGVRRCASEPHTGTGIAWTSGESDASLAVRAGFYGPLLTTLLMSAHRTV